MPEKNTMPVAFRSILDDRESGSVALLNRLIQALDKELQRSDRDMGSFRMLLNAIRPSLQHFAAIDNFLSELIIHMELSGSAQKNAFPAHALQFLSGYCDYWQDSGGKIAANFLQHCKPEKMIFLTHSHSETIIKVLSQLRERQVPFQVLQTLSAPGEEGRKAIERMHRLKMKADLVADEHLQGALARADHILMGCDALMSTEFLNKLGTREILLQAGQVNKPSFLLAESRKAINRPAWKKELKEQSLFEWVPLDLIDTMVSEKTDHPMKS